MDFFDRQDLARKKTGRLVVLFFIAVVLIVAAVNGAAYGIMRLVEPHARFARDAAPVLREARRYPGTLTREQPIWRRPDAYIVTTIVTLAIVAGGSLFKIAMLAGGGPAVAESMGGRSISPDSLEPDEVKLRNVVEEMSIASGVPVPQLYVMEDEDGINAFAAGFTTDDAVIGVTRGCLTRLTRDELQGVIAHEFSHILNGDMRLNLRLIGLLHGILVIGLLGYGTLRVSGSVGRSSDDSKGLGGALLILIAGAALLIIGYVGVFFGRLIQAAVSRQREFLADASAVQFTRNPRGLASALAKIAHESSRTPVQNTAAIEAAHLFFANVKTIGFTDLLATHPPIDERIRAIDPTFAGITETEPTARMADDARLSQAGAFGFAPRPTSKMPAREVTGVVGRPTPETVRFASDLLAALPREVTRAAHDPFSARAVALAILISDDADVRRQQIQVSQTQLDPSTIQELIRLLPAVERLPDAAHLPLLDLALPALRELSGEQRHQFRAAARALIEADGRVSVFEYAMYHVLRNQLGSPDASRRPRPVKYFSMRPLIGDIVTVLSALAYRVGADRDSAADALRRGFDALGTDEPVPAAQETSLAAVDAALDRLAESSPPIRRRVVHAAAEVVAADGIVESDEAEILRAACAALDVPLPPLLSPIA